MFYYTKLYGFVVLKLPLRSLGPNTYTVRSIRDFSGDRRAGAGKKDNELSGL